MKIRPSGLLIVEDKLLTLKYNYNGNEVFALPGGNQENQDGLKETLIREFEEELNLKISVHDLVLVAESLNNKGIKILHLVFKVDCENPQPIINPEQTSCFGFDWLSMSELDKINLYPNLSHHLNKPNQNQVFLGLLNQQWF
ncbi:MAG: NUDIX domain-containing protein [Cytophagales bacterium]